MATPSIRQRKPYSISLLLATLAAVSVAGAKVTAEQAAELGARLTPVGAVQAGSDDGQIPAWDGGLTKAPAGYKAGKHLVDPFPDDKPIFVITAANMEQYAEFLSEGQKALLKQYKSYKLNVYQSRRTAALPEWMYEETKKNATRVELTNEGNGFTGTVRGYPFPIPQGGREAMWNHMVRYRTTGIRGHFISAIVEKGGDYVVERNYVEYVDRYNNPKLKPEKFNNMLGYVFLKTVAPASKSGDAVLVHIPLDRIKEQARVWQFNKGMRRVTRVSKVGYDHPAMSSMVTHDQFDMFNGPMDRYNFVLVGKRNMITPYNGYRVVSNKLKYKDIIQPNHVNPEYTRYEMHRVWIVDAKLKEGLQHLYKRRRFYIDEDSWQIVMQDIYDQRDNFWRYSEAHPLTNYSVPFVVNSLQMHYDMPARRYVVMNLVNEEKRVPQHNFNKPAKYFSTAGLKRFAR